MRIGIRYQLLLPLITLMLGVVAMSTWTALASAGTVARHVEKQLQDLAATVKLVTLPRQSANDETHERGAGCPRS